MSEFIYCSRSTSGNTPKWKMEVAANSKERAANKKEKNVED
jgi:hypothetical protein